MNRLKPSTGATAPATNVVVAFRLRDPLLAVPGITGHDVRLAVETEIERLLTLLDAFDGDVDDENELDLREGDSSEDLELDEDAGAEDFPFDEAGRDYINGGNGI